MPSQAAIEPFLDKIICGDALEEMKKIPDSSVDLVVTSPPYNANFPKKGLPNATRNLYKAISHY